MFMLQIMRDIEIVNSLHIEVLIIQSRNIEYVWKIISKKFFTGLTEEMDTFWLWFFIIKIFILVFCAYLYFKRDSALSKLCWSYFSKFISFSYLYAAIVYKITLRNNTQKKNIIAFKRIYKVNKRLTTAAPLITLSLGEELKTQK